MKTLIVNRNIILIIAIMLLIYGIQGIKQVHAQNNAPELTPVKDRTQQVQDRIVALALGVDAADDVTAADLAVITHLNLSDQSITALKAGDFDGLSALRTLSLARNTLSSLPADIFSGLSALIRLELDSNQLSSLPDGLFSGVSSLSWLDLSDNSLGSLSANTFSGLSALTVLDLGNNQLSSLPDGLFSGLSSLNSLSLSGNTVDLSIAVSLEKIGDNQFKATIATGAPFNLVLPVSVTNGSIDGGATTVTIPTGSVEANPSPSFLPPVHRMRSPR